MTFRLEAPKRQTELHQAANRIISYAKREFGDIKWHDRNSMIAVADGMDKLLLEFRKLVEEGRPQQKAGKDPPIKDPSIKEAS